MKKKVWDLPTRIFHWSFAVCFVVAFIASRREWLIDYHVLAGSLAAGLAAFRFFWGFAGNSNARFSAFLRGWSEIKGFMVGVIGLRPARYAGHNPAVGYVVVMMLSLAALLAITGIIVYTGEEMKGPLAGAVSFETAQTAALVHELAAWAFLALICLHMTAAILHDAFWREGLIVSMLTGDKAVDWYVEPPADDRPILKRLSYAAFIAVTAAFVLATAPFGMHQDVQASAMLAGKSGLHPVERNKAYEQECGSCHNAFSPTLLPARSWVRVMGSLDDHFGEDASIDKDTAAQISLYLAASSAEMSVSEASRKTLASLAGATPLRITESPYWKEKHSGIQDHVYERKTVTSRTNCAACHPGAPLGSFVDREISIPLG